MENLTHTIVGLMMARVGLEKTTPRGAGMMMLAANAPDIDAVFWLGGTLRYLEYHRSYTHSFAFMPIVALLPMLLTRVKFSWQSYLASLAGVLSHLLLDWTNAYGIPLLLPFSAHKFRLDTVNIVDFWIWAILLGALAATALVRLVSGEIGAGKGLGARRGWAWAALLLLLSYEGGREVAHDRAVGVMSARLYEGAPPKSVTALPGALNPFAWRGVVEGNGFVIVVPVNLRGDYDLSAGRLYRTAMPGPAIQAALRTHPFQVFRRFAQLPFWQVMPVENGTQVTLMDLRFGDPGNPGFAGVSAVVDHAGRVLRAGLGF
jgi:inner membrane protein